MRFGLAFLVSIFLPMVAIAQATPSPTSVAPIVTEPVSVDQALGMGGLLLELFKSGQYLAAAALLTLVGVFLVRKYVLPKIGLKPGVLPIVSAVLGVLSGSAVALASGAPKDAAVLALLAGPAASQMWDALIRYFFAKPEAK